MVKLQLFYFLFEFFKYPVVGNSRNYLPFSEYDGFILTARNADVRPLGLAYSVYDAPHDGDLDAFIQTFRILLYLSSDTLYVDTRPRACWTGNDFRVSAVIFPDSL